MAAETIKKRSLILAGGGIKVAFQAGVLQVWLDEAGLKFDHVDAASGGVFNLAMMCQGMSGKQIADNWRNMDPISGIDLNLSELPKLFYAESLFTLDNFRNKVFKDWGLNWEKIRASNLNASFNVVNFSRKEIRVLDPEEINEELFVACVSLPMWFPPVKFDGETYIDAVYLTDANIEEAIRRGADEVWVIWTVSDKDEWHSGFVANYFQIIETAAVGNYRAILKRIAKNNEAIQAGKTSEFGRHIDVKELKADVPLHYLINFSQDRLHEAVNFGVMKAREWCNEKNIALNISQEYPTEIRKEKVRLWFTEEMKGYFAFGDKDFNKGFEIGKEKNTSIMFRLTITIDDVNTFVTDPDHDTENLSGYIECPSMGGKLPVEKGRFNLFVDRTDSSQKNMLYRLFFRDGEGNALTLSGFKDIKDDSGLDLWADTTTLYTSILKGHISEKEERSGQAELIGAGKINIYFFDFLKQLTTFRTEASTISEKLNATTSFGRLFMGKLWDVYAKEVLSSGPF